MQLVVLIPAYQNVLLCVNALSSCRVLYISVHRGNGFYPGTGHVEEVGTGDGRGFTLNVPWLKARSTLHALQPEVQPLLSGVRSRLL